MSGFAPTRTLAIIALSVEWPLAGLLLISVPAPSHAAVLKKETVQAWEQYIQEANTRVKKRFGSGSHFLWIDESPERSRRVRDGEILVSQVDGPIPQNMRYGLIHDWIGAVFIPKSKLDDFFAVIRDYGRYKEFYKPLIVESKPLGHVGMEDRFSMRWRNASLLGTIAFEGEFESTYFQLDETRWYGIGHSTSVQEIDNDGQPDEHELPTGQGHGYIWRLYNFSRVEQRDGGVYAEIEAIGLSREIPALVRWLVGPLARRLARSALLTSLRQTADAVRASIDKRGPAQAESLLRTEPPVDHEKNIEEEKQPSWRYWIARMAP